MEHVLSVQPSISLANVDDPGEQNTKISKGPFRNGVILQDASLTYFRLLFADSVVFRYLKVASRVMRYMRKETEGDNEGKLW